MNCYIILIIVTSFYYLLISAHDDNDEGDSLSIIPKDIYHKRPEKKWLTFADKNEPVKQEPTEEEQDSLKWHIHLFRIIWSKMAADKAVAEQISNKQLPLDVYLHLYLTEDGLSDFLHYYETGDSNFTSSVSQHLLNGLSVISPPTPSTQEATYHDTTANKRFPLNIIMIVTLGLVIVIGLRRYRIFTALILIVVVFFHKAYELYLDDNVVALHDSSRTQPSHCYATNINVSLLSKFLSIFMNEHGDCLAYYRAVHVSPIARINLIRISAALLSDFTVTFLRPSGDLLGGIYVGLNQHVPFWMAWLLLGGFGLFLIVMMSSILWVYLRSPRKQQLQAEKQANVIKDSPRHRRVLMWKSVMLRRRRHGRLALCS